MEIRPSTTPSDNPPSYDEATNPRNPPPYEHPPSYAQATGTQPSTSNSRAPSEPASNLREIRIANSVTSGLTRLGMRLLSRL
jgi:hypothetical protein